MCKIKITNYILRLIKGVISFFKIVKGILVYRISCILHQQNKLILYYALSDNRFGNIEALEKYFECKGIDFIRLYHKDMIKSTVRFWNTLASARVLVIDSKSPASRVSLCKNTVLIHCWHAGGAYKKIGFDVKIKVKDRYKEEARIKRVHRNISYFVCSSELTAQVYARAFRLRNDQMLVLGLPRLDEVLTKASKGTPSKYTILYAPTYRTSNNGERVMPNTSDLEFAGRVLKEKFGNEICLAFRGHPTSPSFNVRGWDDWTHRSLNDALMDTSVLITDYSSVFFDFIPYERPIVFYVPDLEKYCSEYQGVYFSPYEYFNETTCGDVKTLILILSQYQNKKLDYTMFWNEQMSACDGYSTERLGSFIIDLMKKGTI